MALLSLKDIGKIYVSDTNVTVGIRGVSLDFERGEFVAITGKSGSGKSTLLNVISGMDSYEEGELLIEGETTSHYMQPDWESYREKYISFIFQDYNIIESFTVLQNVELALMHIEDKAARRARAMELIRRVGLASHARHKGSKLSGGQKQRTVIARALAKDSPIILADEPTGNLDSVSSREIIELLREVSKDKLLIVVTHNFDQVAEHATRHVRIFDGAVEFDHEIRTSERPIENATLTPKKQRSERDEILHTVKNGAILGRDIFTAKPRLSLFLCLLLIIGTLGIFFSTSLCGSAGSIFSKNYMFTHIPGRVVLAQPSGEVIPEDALKALVKEHGAEGYLHFDSLLDDGFYSDITIPVGKDETDFKSLKANAVYGKDYGDDILGRYPKKSNEILLYLPIAYRDVIGKKAIECPEILVSETAYQLVGVKYFIDNNLPAECLFTEAGFRTATAIEFLSYEAARTIHLTVTDEAGHSLLELSHKDITVSFDMDRDSIYPDSNGYKAFLANQSASGEAFSTKISFVVSYNKYNYLTGESKYQSYQKDFEGESIVAEKPSVSALSMRNKSDGIIISDELIVEIAENVLASTYKQASIFFENDKAAHAAAEKMQDAGYIAVPSDTTYELSGVETILQLFSVVMLGFAWLLSILFLSFFINLCTSRILGAFKGDMAIMRSMGIPVKVIRVGMYFRMLIALIPAFILMVLTAILIFTTPKFNLYFTYLYGYQYALIFLGMLLLTARTTRKQIYKLFNESVKKSLKGGASE